MQAAVSSFRAISSSTTMQAADSSFRSAISSSTAIPFHGVANPRFSSILTAKGMGHIVSTGRSSVRLYSTSDKFIKMNQNPYMRLFAIVGVPLMVLSAPGLYRRYKVYLPFVKKDEAEVEVTFADVLSKVSPLQVEVDKLQGVVTQLLEKVAVLEQQRANAPASAEAPAQALKP